MVTPPELGAIIQKALQSDLFYHNSQTNPDWGDMRAFHTVGMDNDQKFENHCPRYTIPFAVVESPVYFIPLGRLTLYLRVV